MQEIFVTVATFDNSIDAHIAKSKLESEGIDSYIADENIVSVYPLYNITVGGIKLRTRSSDEDAARTILDAVSKLPYTDERDEVIKCPKCNSEKIYTAFTTLRSIKTIVGVLLSFLTSTSPLARDTKLKCKNCGYEFEKKSFE